MHNFYIFASLAAFIVEVVVINKIDSMLTEYTPVAFLRIDSNKFGFLITELVKKFFAYTSESLICYAGPDF